MWKNNKTLYPVLMLGALLLAGCAGTRPGEQSAEAPDTARLQALVDRISEEQTAPGTLVLLRGPWGEWRYARGSRGLSTDETPGFQDHFRIGSNTKTMTGTVVLQLVEDGRLSLDDEVTQLLPDFTAEDYPALAGVRVRHLLDMSSGLVNYTENESFQDTLDREPDRVWQPEALARIGLKEPRLFEPGEGMKYSNTNTVLLGLIVEELTGKALAAEMDGRIFRPLGLTRTWLPAPEDAGLPEPHLRGYIYQGEAVGDDGALSEAKQADARAGRYLPDEVTYMNPSWGYAAGAAVSTMEELAVYVEALVGGGLLGERMQRTRLESLGEWDYQDPWSRAYGLGLAAFGSMVGHNGSLPGYQTFMGHDPRSGTTLIVHVNLQTGPTGEGPADAIARAIMAELM